MLSVDDDDDGDDDDDDVVLLVFVCWLAVAVDDGFFLRLFIYSEAFALSRYAYISGDECNTCNSVRYWRAISIFFVLQF